MNCPKCGKSSPFTTGSFCANCGTLLTGQLSPHSPAMNPRLETGTESDIPWESRLRHEAPLKALFSTLVTVIFHPVQFYRTAVALNYTAPFPALWYGLITGSLGMTGSWLWSLVIQRYSTYLGEYTSLLGYMSISTSALITTPLMLLAQYFILALYTRFALHFFKHEKASNAQIIRILCYAESTSVLIFIPFAGYLLALATGIYSILTGFHILFNVSRIKLLFILILPLMVLFSVILLLIAGGVIGGAIAGAGLLNQQFPFFR